MRMAANSKGDRASGTGSELGLKPYTSRMLIVPGLLFKDAQTIVELFAYKVLSGLYNDHWDFLSGIRQVTPSLLTSRGPRYEQIEKPTLTAASQALRGNGTSPDLGYQTLLDLGNLKSSSRDLWGLWTTL